MAIQPRPSAGSASSRQAANKLAVGPARAARAAPASNHPLAPSSASMRNCLPSSWRRASELPGKLPGIFFVGARRAANSPPGLNGGATCLGERIEGRDHLDQSGRARASRATGTAGFCLLPQQRWGLCLTRSRRAPDRNRRAARLESKAAPARTQAEWQPLKMQVVDTIESAELSRANWPKLNQGDARQRCGLS